MELLVVGGAGGEVTAAAVEGAALVAEHGIVDHAGVPIDEGATAVGIVEGGAAGGIALGRQRPEVDVRERAEVDCVAPADESLVLGCVAGPCRRGTGTIGGRDGERHELSGGAPGDPRREDAVTGDRIALLAVIPHGELGDRGGGIDA